MIGRKLRHYVIEETLGKGGMGEVYRALDSRLNRPVAIKILPPEVVKDPHRLRQALASYAVTTYLAADAATLFDRPPPLPGR